MDEDQINPNPSQSNRAAAAVAAPEVVLDGGIRVSEFPPAVRRVVNRPHSSVVAILAVERASRCGESSTQNAVVLENISYGQLQALSAVLPDSLGEQDRGDGSYVITAPMLMEGRGVVKRFGSSLVHVVPMHAGNTFIYHHTHLTLYLSYIYICICLCMFFIGLTARFCLNKTLFWDSFKASMTP